MTERITIGDVHCARPHDAREHAQLCVVVRHQRVCRRDRRDRHADVHRREREQRVIDRVARQDHERLHRTETAVEQELREATHEGILAGLVFGGTPSPARSA